MTAKEPTRRGGCRPGAGRKAPQGRGRPVTIYLNPAQLAVCLAHGDTVQAGLRALIAAHLTDSHKTPPPTHPNPRQP